MKSNYNNILDIMKTYVPESEVQFHDFFWSEVYEVHYKSILKKIINNIACKQNLKVLDAGAGYGYWSLFFHNLGHQVVSVDQSLNCVKVLDTLGEITNNKITRIQSDLENIEALDTNCFDISFSFATLHVLNDPVTALKEMARLTKPGGYIVVCVANVKHPVNLLFWNNASNVNYELEINKVDAMIKDYADLDYREISILEDSRIKASLGEKPFYFFNIYKRNENEVI